MITAAVFITIFFLFILSFKYPSVMVAMYLTAGFMKVFLIIQVPFFRTVDYTLLCGLLLFIVMSFWFFKNRGDASAIFSAPVMCYFLLCFVLLLGATYTSAPKYGWEKSLRVLTLGTIAMLSPLFIITQVERLKEFIITLFIVGLIIAIGTVVAPYAGVYRAGAEFQLRGSFLEADPLESATKIAVALIIAFYFCILAGLSFKAKAWLFVTMPLMLVAIVLTGSRGPFIGVFICFVIAFILARKKLSAVSLPLTFILVLAAMVYIFVKLPEEQTHRILNLFKGQYEAAQALETRSGPFGWVLTNAMNSPVWGNGTGSFAMDYGEVDERLYPHNIFLELLYENGILGLIPFIVFLWLIFKRWLIARTYAAERYPIHIANSVDLLGLLFFFNFIQSMKSNDIDGYRFSFFTCGLILAAYTALEKYKDYDLYGDDPMPAIEYQDLYLGEEQQVYE